MIILNINIFERITLLQILNQTRKKREKVCILFFSLLFIYSICVEQRLIIIPFTFRICFFPSLTSNSIRNVHISYFFEFKVNTESSCCGLSLIFLHANCEGYNSRFYFAVVLLLNSFVSLVFAFNELSRWIGGQITRKEYKRILGYL